MSNVEEGDCGKDRGNNVVNQKLNLNCHPYRRAHGNHDGNCVYCGFIIRNLFKDKPRYCPQKLCGRELPRFIGYGYDGWGRCPNTNCWRFTHWEFSFCQHCGFANSEAIAKSQRLKVAELQRSHLTEKRRANELQAKNQQQQLELEKLRALVKKEDEHHMKQVLPVMDDYSQKDIVEIDNLEQAASGDAELTKDKIDEESMLQD